MRDGQVSKRVCPCLCVGALAVAAVLAVSAFAAAVESTTPALQPPAASGAITFPKIDRKPGAMPYRAEVTSIPKYSRDERGQRNAFECDLRGADLSGLDLRKSGNDLLYSVFDTNTVWPPAERRPAGFDPKAILEMGKNPGLGVRSLHARGITGRGVGIAIIDMPLLTAHVEYADNLRLYEEMNVMPGSRAAMHGAATASIAVGKTVGVAPGADLYFIANYPMDLAKLRQGGGMPGRDFTTEAKAVLRVLEINRQLPADRKIRTISLSVGWDPSEPGYKEMVAAVEAARTSGLLISSSSIEETHGVGYHGLGREPMADPDKFESYGPGLWWAKQAFSPRWAGRIMMPMDSRTVASFTGKSDYAFMREGGWSWVSPYLAGVYALACQVSPEITPDEFLELAKKTGRTVKISRNGQEAPFGPIVDPVAIIEALEGKGGAKPAAVESSGKK